MHENLSQLRESLTGDVLGPSDREYERARLCFNLLIDRRPAAIARCVDAHDVATSLAFAQSHGLEIAVRGGGHNPAGHCAVDDGLVIDLSRMRNVEVDPDARIAISEGGATWLDFDAATQAHGLVTPGGVVGSTGVAGLAFGGGIGHLTAQYGLTCDNLIAAELVIPTGEVVRASDDENPELLWGLRGGGGNFGVATRLEFRLHPLGRVVGGRFEYAGDGVLEAIRTFRDLDAGAGTELSCQAQLTVDENLTPALTIAPCYTGRDDDPEEHRALRSAPGLVSDGVRSQGFLDQQRIFDPGYGVDRNYWKSHFVRQLPDELIDELLACIATLGRPPGGILLESLRGGPKTVDPGSAALGYRDAAFNISVMASWTDPAADDDHIAWARETAAAIEPWSVSGGYVNYMQADEPLDRVRAAFGPEAFDRLRALKSRHDPDNILHRNQNIPPTVRRGSAGVRGLDVSRPVRAAGDPQRSRAVPMGSRFWERWPPTQLVVELRRRRWRLRTWLPRSTVQRSRCDADAVVSWRSDSTNSPTSASSDSRPTIRLSDGTSSQINRALVMPTRADRLRRCRKSEERDGDQPLVRPRVGIDWRRLWTAVAA